jgi:hypothetical protein
VSTGDGVAAKIAADGCTYGTGCRTPLLRRGPGGNTTKSSKPADPGFIPPAVQVFSIDSV